MAEFQFDDDPGTLNQNRASAAALTICSVLLAIAGAISALVGAYSLSSMTLPAGGHVLGVATIVVVTLFWWSWAALLWGQARIVIRTEDLRADLHAVLRDSAESAAATGRRGRAEAPQADQQARFLEQLVHLVREQRDIALLSEHERNLRSRGESRALVEQLERDIPVLLREHNWHEARHRVEDARLRFPALSVWDTLAEQVEQARMKYEAQDIERATREVDEMIALGAWDRAANAALEAQHRHPNSEAAAELVRRVSTQRDKATAEERTRLMARAQEFTNQRNWVDALRTVEEVLERFPKSLEARDLRLQLPVLQANAEIQTRQAMEHEIRELVHQKRYTEALRRAQTLIGRYPDSPQAKLLREQLPKLEQKAGVR